VIVGDGVGHEHLQLLVARRKRQPLTHIVQLILKQLRQ
jgi:hypothetical protein